MKYPLQRRAPKSTSLLLRDLPFRVLLKRIGTFEFWVHVRDIKEAARAMHNYQTALALKPEDVCYPHGVVLDREGCAQARLHFNGQVAT